MCPLLYIASERPLFFETDMIARKETLAFGRMVSSALQTSLKHLLGGQASQITPCHLSPLSGQRGPRLKPESSLNQTPTVGRKKKKTTLAIYL